MGYTYATTLRTRCAYQWSVETSVYISSNYYRRGIGKSLYLELFEILKRQGIVNVFAGITLPHQSSVALHENLGFEKIGVYKDIGHKFGTWVDVGWWQLQFQKPEKPSTPLPFSKISWCDRSCD